MFLAWVIFPLLLFAIAVGCGLLVRAASDDLPGAILPIAGLAVIVVVGQLTTLADATAERTAPLVVVLAPQPGSEPDLLPSGEPVRKGRFTG